MRIYIHPGIVALFVFLGAGILAGYLFKEYTLQKSMMGGVLERSFHESTSPKVKSREDNRAH